MDAIKGTMTEIYNDLSKSTSGNTIVEVGLYSQLFSDYSGDNCDYYSYRVHVFILQIRRLRIEIEKLQWLHQQELSEMKHNLGENLGHLKKILPLYIYISFQK